MNREPQIPETGIGEIQELLSKVQSYTHYLPYTEINVPNTENIKYTNFPYGHFDYQLFTKENHNSVIDSEED